MRRLITVIAITCSCWLLSSCSKSPYEIADVEGTALCNGKPLTAGFVIFAPVSKNPGSVSEKPGKPATGKLDEDGRFILSTFGNEDGAVVGQHTARVSIPSGDDDEGEAARPPCSGTVYEPGTKEPRIFEVVSGENNEFTLEFSNPRVKTGPWAAP